MGGAKIERGTPKKADSKLLKGARAPKKSIAPVTDQGVLFKFWGGLLFFSSVDRASIVETQRITPMQGELGTQSVNQKFTTFPPRRTKVTPQSTTQITARLHRFHFLLDSIRENRVLSRPAPIDTTYSPQTSPTPLLTTGRGSVLCLRDLASAHWLA